MPSPAPAPPGSLVLVSGVNGHVASLISYTLLASGYRVRGTVRAIKSGAAVIESFATFGDRFEVVEVPVISKEGAFDSAMEDVDAVIHAASPVTLDAKRPEEQFVPAVEGTLSALRTAANTPSVKRFVYLGSTASAVMSGKDSSKEPLTRDDWNIVSPDAVKNLEDPWIGFHIYCGSKIAAEKAAWEFVEKNKPSFGLTVVLCSMVLGRIYKDITGPPRQDIPAGQLYDVFADPPRQSGVSPVVSVVWVHGEDVADLFMRSLTSDKTPGQRLIAHAGLMSWERVAGIVRGEFPERPIPPVRDDAPTMMYPGALHTKFNSAFELELLGGSWRPLDDAILKMSRDLIGKEQKGWDKHGA